jgi:hypothetical protein
VNVGRVSIGTILSAGTTSGDRVTAENLYQHAEHYFRIMNAANEGHQHRVMRPDAPADVETEMAEEEGSEMAGPVRASPRPSFGASRVRATACAD